MRTLLDPAAKKTLLDAIEEKESSLSKEITIVEARSERQRCYVSLESPCAKNLAGRKYDHLSVEGTI